MLRPGKSTSLRLVLLGAIIAYLVGDLFIFKGPLNRTIERYASPNPDLVARVSGHPITHSQLERALNERLWLEGKNATSLVPADLKLARNAALDELIDELLLDLQIDPLNTQLAVSHEEISERLARLSARFEDKGAFTAAMKSEGIVSEQALRDWLAALIRREKYVELRIAPAIKVTDEEAWKWFLENNALNSQPERIEARHIFLPTLDHPPEEAKLKLDAALTELIAKKKDFPTLARELSEDPATKDSGGNLGWMTRDRLPADFAVPVFSLEINKPTLVRTKLGWHLVEVTARKAAETRSFDQAKPEILAALETVKRRSATGALRKSLRQASSGEIEIFK